MSTPSIALAGNPNSGKTTLFNRLTGLNHRVGNYPGVTVERRAGHVAIAGAPAQVIDLPGTYSLISRSRDEAVAFEVITGAREKKPDLVLIVADASNLDRNLYLALQILELGTPAVVALNMIDLATERGLIPDPALLSEKLGVPVVPVVANEGRGVDELKRVLARALEDRPVPKPRAWRVGDDHEAVIDSVKQALIARGKHATHADGEAVWILSSIAFAADDREDDAIAHFDDPSITSARARIDRTFAARVIEARYGVATSVAESSTTQSEAPKESRTDKVDTVLLHPIFGALIFLGIMTLLFQSIFAWAEPLMDLIESAVGLTQGAITSTLPEGAIADLLADGVVGGVGNVLVFIPQIAILFFFLAILEDSGYLARAAFITDRLMAKIGLHGRAFVPLLSGFACAVPAIMATRTIETKKDRLVTILVTPLMSCSARLPVYGIVISSLFAGSEAVFGFISVGGLLLLAMYALSVTMTIFAAFVLKRTLLKSPTPPFVLELPPYRAPALKSVLGRVIERCKVFVRDAGTMILACSIVLWALLYFPRGEVHAPAATPEVSQQVIDDHLAADRLRNSYAGRLGHLIEPAIAPLGYDWKIGIGLLASFAAREVFVSTMGLVYGVGRDADDESVPLRDALRAERDPRSGKAVYTPLVGLSLMVFFLLACQCMSTLAVVRRETGSWRWPLFMFAYMSVLAWFTSFVVYQGGKLLGFS